MQLYESNKSAAAKTAVEQIAKLYEVERELHGKDLEEVLQQQRSRSAPVANSTLHEWLLAHRARVPEGSVTARAIDYSLNQWTALAGPAAADRQQPRRATDQALGYWKKELAIGRHACRRTAGGGDREPELK